MNRRRLLALVIVVVLLVGGGAWMLESHWTFDPPGPTNRGQTVVLVHGLGRTWLSMVPLGAFLRNEGYRVILYGYPSTRYGLTRHAESFADYIEHEVFPGSKPGSIHFVGHSLGNILVRQALGETPDPVVGRIVMLAPPNQGSYMADELARWRPLVLILHPLAELAARPGTAIHDVPIPEMEIGIIAGRDDGKVAPELTHLPGNVETDFLEVPAVHSFLMNRDDVQRATLEFLETGRFQAALQEQIRK